MLIPAMPDALPREIERKWVCSAVPPLVNGRPFRWIDQGYLPGTRLVERIRRVQSELDVVQWFRTVKLGSGLSRIEIEEETTPELGAALMALALGKRVEKVRYAIPDGDLVWEVDCFTDGDLVLVELELPSEDAPFTIPEWLAPYIVREVTEDRAFKNESLAR